MAEPVKLTPLMEQYINIKKQHPDEVVFFRLGDFYEMFFEDAVMVSRLLNLTLTHRADSPMCGVPYQIHVLPTRLALSRYATAHRKHGKAK